MKRSCYNCRHLLLFLKGAGYENKGILYIVSVLGLWALCPGVSINLV